ncbi:MAG TPA: xylulokinase [Candidatus Nanopelagicaceae bacterium]|nr:xylulokinase [Candidatus Nanopelagicaceae bacterium]
MPKIVAGVDSSTQSVKVVLRDAESGELIASTSRPHPDGTEVNPLEWKKALDSALDELGKYEISAISIGGQQHGMVALDHDGAVIRDALLWNDTRSDKAAQQLNSEIPDIHERTGSQLVASFTASKVRWLADNEKSNAERVAAIALPHDWLSWQLSGANNLNSLFTDRSDASGTGYFDSVKNEYCRDIFATALRSQREVVLPKIIAPNSFGGETSKGVPIAAGAGDNAGAALGLGAGVGDLVISLGTSGTAFAVSSTSTHDPSGEVAGFADATGNFLPLACTLNAAKIFNTVATTLGISFEEFSSLALNAPAGAEGLRIIPHFDGERTPNRPQARGFFSGITHSNFTKANIARAAIEGVVAGMVYATQAVEKLGVSYSRVLLIGGAAKNPAVQQIAADFFGKVIHIPPTGEYVADGAAKQAAWALSGRENPPQWSLGEVKEVSPSSQSEEVVASYMELIKA